MVLVCKVKKWGQNLPHLGTPRVKRRYGNRMEAYTIPWPRRAPASEKKREQIVTVCTWGKRNATYTGTSTRTQNKRTDRERVSDSQSRLRVRTCAPEPRARGTGLRREGRLKLRRRKRRTELSIFL